MLPCKFSQQCFCTFLFNAVFIFCQATTFSNPVYESVYRSETSLGSEVLRDKDLPKVEFRRSKADFSNPVYEALLAHNNSRKPGSVFWGSAENMNGEASGDQAETDCWCTTETGHVLARPRPWIWGEQENVSRRKEMYPIPKDETTAMFQEELLRVCWPFGRLTFGLVQSWLGCYKMKMTLPRAVLC